MGCLAEIVAGFTADPGANSKNMRDLLRVDCPRFLSDAVPLLREAPDSAGLDYLVALLGGNGLTVPLLMDQSALTDESAITVAQRLVRIDPTLDVRLMQFAVVAQRSPTSAELNRGARRVLGIIAAFGDRRRTAPLLMMLLRHPDKYVRSRAALLLGNTTRNCAWAVEQLRSDDARIRANVIESLWGVTSKESRHLFRAAAADRHNRVAGNALLGLYLSGAEDSVRLIAAMAGSTEPAFRCTGAWVMGRTYDPRFIWCLNPMLADTAPGVRRNVLRALGVLRRIRRTGADLHVTFQPEGLEGDRDIFRVRVSDGAARPVRGLPGTAFTCWCGDELITDYDIEASPLSPGHYLLQVRLNPRSKLRVEVYAAAADPAH